MTDSPLVLIRTDADATIGTGHLVRCLTLAGALQDRGATVVLAARDLAEPLRQRVSAAGVELRDLPEGPRHGDQPLPDVVQRADADAVLEALVGCTPDWAVIDSYALAAPWAEQIRAAVGQVAVIDDLADRTHDADLLLDQNWFGPDTAQRYDGLVTDETVLLLGPRYALLQSAYREARATAVPFEQREPRVVASFGGSDPTGETTKLLEGTADLLNSHDVAMDVVIGGAAPDREAVHDQAAGHDHIHVHSNLPSLAPLLAAATLGIGAGGATTWERVCLDVPALVTVVADNQAESIAALAAADVVRSLGPASRTTAATYPEAVGAAMHGEVPVPPPLVDGWGAQRVALAMLGATPQDVTVRPAAAGDDALFLGPDLRREQARSYLRGPEVWHASLAALRAGRSMGTAWTAEVAGVPVGGTTGDDVHLSPGLPDAVADRAAGLLRDRAQGGPPRQE